jgi:hypothetical protein
MSIQATKEFSPLSADDAKIAVQGYGVRVEIHPDGDVIVYAQGRVKTVKPGADAELSDTAIVAPEIGAKMPDGSIYAGVSSDSGKPIYATPADSGLCAKWRKAMDYAAGLDAHGHRDWRVPTRAELNVLFTNRAAIGNFNETGSTPAGWYWSSSRDDGSSAWTQRFSDGDRGSYSRYDQSSLRCVRGNTARAKPWASVSRACSCKPIATAPR